MKKIFVDTGAWYALIDRKDPDHLKVAEAFQDFDGRLVTSNFVMDESLTLLRYRCSYERALDLGRFLISGRLAEVVRIKADDELKAWRVFEKYQDKLLSFTDCTSFVLMERLGLETALSLDSDFRQMGFRCLPEP